MMNHFSNCNGIKVTVEMVKKYLDKAIYGSVRRRGDKFYYLTIDNVDGFIIDKESFIKDYPEDFPDMTNVIFAEEHDVVNLVFNYGLTNCWVTALQITFPQLIRVPSE